MTVVKNLKRKVPNVDESLAVIARELASHNERKERELEFQRSHSRLVTIEDLNEMEKRLVSAIRKTDGANLAPLTEKLREGTEALETAVEANQPETQKQKGKT